MTVIGIGGCMGLIVVGFGLQDSITAIAKNQFVNLFTYQASAVFNGDATEEKKHGYKARWRRIRGYSRFWRCIARVWNCSHRSAVWMR